MPDEDDEYPPDILYSRRIALIDSTGKMILDWKETNYSYYVSDGIISLANNDKYETWNWMDLPDRPNYYKLDGSQAFDYSNIPNSDPMVNGRALVYDNSNSDNPKLYLIDSNGNTIHSFTGAYVNEVSSYGSSYTMTSVCETTMGWYSEGLIPCGTVNLDENGRFHDDYSNMHFFYVDESGNIVIDLSNSGIEVDGSYPFFNGYAKIRDTSGNYGFIDKTGKLVIPLEYENASKCFGELFVVCKNGKWGYINNKNEVVIPFEYDDAFGGSNGYAAVGKNGKYGIVDYTNSIIVPLEYDDISGVENGIAYAIKNGTVHIIKL